LLSEQPVISVCKFTADTTSHCVLLYVLGPGVSSFLEENGLDLIIFLLELQQSGSMIEGQPECFNNQLTSEEKLRLLEFEHWYQQLFMGLDLCGNWFRRQDNRLLDWRNKSPSNLTTASILSGQRIVPTNVLLRQCLAPLVNLLYLH